MILILRVFNLTRTEGEKQPMSGSFFSEEPEKVKEPTVNDSLTKYFTEVSSVIMLSAAAERTLISEYKTATNQKIKNNIRDRVIKGALKFVISEARRHPRSKDRAAFQDLIAAGNIGLLRALEKFDLDQGTRFLTYAGWWVRHEMREENKHLNICHIPTHASSKGVAAPVPVEYTDAIVPSEITEDAADSLHNKQNTLKLLDMSILNTHERFIIKTCFGIDTTPKTLRQVGKLLVITGERVRQLRETAITKMRNAATTQQLDG